jgi:hypothetical protein
MVSRLLSLRALRERIVEWQQDRLFRLWREEWRERRGY